jgi:hypothetical protein
LKTGKHRTFLPVLLCGFETYFFFFILRTELKLQALKKTVLRRIYGSKEDEKIGNKFRIYHKEKLYNLYKLHNIVKTAKSGKLYWTKYMAKWGGKESDSEF